MPSWTRRDSERALSASTRNVTEAVRGAPKCVPLNGLPKL